MQKGSLLQLTVQKKIISFSLLSVVLCASLSAIIFFKIKDCLVFPDTLITIRLKGNEIHQFIETIETTEMNLGKYFSDGKKEYLEKVIENTDLITTTASSIFDIEGSEDLTSEENRKKLLSILSSFRVTTEQLKQKDLVSLSSETKRMAHEQIGQSEELAYKQEEVNLAKIQLLSDMYKKRFSEALEFIVMALVVTSFLLILLMYYIMHTTITPLKQLHSAALAAKQGEFKKRIYLSSNDELHDIAETINHLAIKLQESISDEEEKVREKTKDLEKKLEEMEHINELMIGRELQMIELKKKLEGAQKQKEVK